ncbi:class D sortase [Bacillus weihaiensis]|uniref:class D sortase n=1 Tax=Bacillus weihaiensis TaxID=1547283 RepID=UPI0023532E04|nr:class D sortase [Bacillus weihaiensis]
MLKWIGRLFIFAGLTVLITVGYLFYDFYYGSSYQTQEANEMLITHGYIDNEIDKNKLMKREDFEPAIGKVYGILEIPEIDLRLPIIYGSELEHLKYGIGHNPSTAFPSDGKQIFLSAHNDSAFLKIDELVPGDEIFINTPYGRYEYTIENTEVAHETETWRVGNDDLEELVLMTCYPFFSLTRPEERYLVYAYPAR